MTPQSQFTVVAPLLPGREASLRALLDSMNAHPGMADAHNTLLPFARFERLHFARLVLLDDALQADAAAYGLAPPPLPTCLAFMGDCDGPAHSLLAELVQHAGDGLRDIFSHCAGFNPGGDVLAWLCEHDRPVAAGYVHWVGRSVQQIRQESALARHLAAQVPRETIRSAAHAHSMRQALRNGVDQEVAAGRLVLSPPPPTPLEWQVHQLIHLLAVPLLGLALLPLLVLLSPLLIQQLRSREKTDPEICPRPASSLLHALQNLEDFDVSNQYTAIGPVKPGRFRRWLVTGLLVLIGYACRHVFTRGHLARVQTIHFARWVFLDGKARVLFTSNYDGSHQGYMDDFINKVAWGLNLVFSNGIGWPRTRWLILGGARQEQPFKYFQRRHQLPTQVWYKAYPGLTLADMRRNQRIRAGLEAAQLSDAQVLEWLELL
jgi:hypothetical protein